MVGILPTYNEDAQYWKEDRTSSGHPMERDELALELLLTNFICQATLRTRLMSTISQFHRIDWHLRRNKEIRTPY